MYLLWEENLLSKPRAGMKSTCLTIDEYISGFPKVIQEILENIRREIRNAVPDAIETINYAIPTFKLNGENLVHFAAFKNHIGFYATPSGHKEFEKQLSVYKQGKGSVQFPLDKHMPFGLIVKIVKFRVQEIASKSLK
jgi:uncharacterized protein YdhG (YjbR/CyaY superfamily)